MDVLVTGGSGFLGRALVDHLADRHSITVLAQNQTDSHLETIVGDLARPASLPAEFEHDAVIHLAAMADPQRCERFPRQAFMVNALGSQAIAERTRGILVFTSTSQVYGPMHGTLTAKAVPRPGNVYATTKLAAENLVSIARGENQATVVRPFNIYGPDQSGPYLIPELFAKARTTRDWSARDPNADIDLIHVDDAVRFFAATLDAPSGTYNLASGETHKVAHVSDRIGNLTGSPPVPHPDLSPARFTVDISNEKDILTWSPRITLDAGLTTLQGADNE